MLPHLLGNQPRHAAHNRDVHICEVQAPAQLCARSVLSLRRPGARKQGAGTASHTPMHTHGGLCLRLHRPREGEDVVGRTQPSPEAMHVWSHALKIRGAFCVHSSHRNGQQQGTPALS